MLGMHGEVLELSEVFAALQPAALPDGSVTGEAFWALLSTPNPAWTAALAAGAAEGELRYALDGSGRYSRSSGVPPILAVCLPAISDEPEDLFDELAPFVRALPPRPIGEMYRALFDALRSRSGASVWVERSGGSMRYARALVAAFPAARFIHLYRNGPETAISMSHHTYFRMELALDTIARTARVDPLSDERALRRAMAMAGVGTEATGQRAQADETVRFGRRWSSMTLLGLSALATLPAEQVLHVAYEALVQDPSAQLRRIATFIGVDANERAWLDSCGQLVRVQPPLVDRLSASKRAALTRACLAGDLAIGQTLNGTVAQEDCLTSPG